MIFRDITTEDIDGIRRCAEASGCRACDSSAVNMFIWKRLYRQEFCFEGNFLFRRSFDKSGMPVYGFPLGRGEIGKALEKTERDAAELGRGFGFWGLTEEQMRSVDALWPGRFEFSEQPDIADYIYTSESLAELPGKKYHSKRNFLNRFEQKYGDISTVLPITQADIREISEYSSRWCAANGCRHDDSSLAVESCAIGTALANWDALGLFGAVLRVDGRVRAYNVASELLPDTADVHVEKADEEIEGAYAVVNNALAKMLRQKYRYINREEDMGLPGLRRAKESYRPAIRLMRYTAAQSGAKS